MKTALLLLFYLGILPVFSTNPTTAGFQNEPYTKEFVEYYKNGNLKCRTTVQYNSDGSEEITVTESFRKNGIPFDFTVMKKTDRLQYIKYDKKGLVKFERNYYYYSNGNIESIETRRPDGEIRIWSNPPPNYPVLY